MKKLNIAIYDSLYHYTPTGVGWYEGFENLGHNPGILESVHNLNAYDTTEQDILVAMDTPTVEDLIQYKLKHPNTKIVYVFFGYKDEYLRLQGVVDLWVEMVIEHKATEEIFYTHNLPLAFIPLGASRRKFYKESSPKTYDVSFIGQFGDRGHGYRHQDIFLYPAIDKGYKGYYGGFSYKNITYPAVEHQRLNTIYNSTKVNLNFHYNYQKTEQSNDPISRQDFNGRVYEIALSGNFQLCDHPRAIDLFENSIPVSDGSNWLQLIDHYLKNESAAEELAYKSSQIAASNHTWDSRMQTLINKLYGKNIL